MNILTAVAGMPATTRPRDHAAAILAAAELLLPHLEHGQKIDAARLRRAMEEAFGASDASGAWTWKLAYEACEAATVLFLRKYGTALFRKAATPEARLSALAKIVALLPTHTRRSEESQALQQFSTPIPLGLAALTAAAIAPDDRVLEPSAGTGLLALLAQMAGGSLILNELADTRAELLTSLFPATPTTRFDAAQIDDHLDAGAIPSVVLMNPPFSAMAHVTGRVQDVGVRHIASALARLAPGGRLVAITGANVGPDIPDWKDAFAALQARARVVFSCAIAGSVYARHGTTFPTRLIVIDKLPADDPSTFPASLGLAPDVTTLLDWIAASVPPRPPVTLPGRTAPAVAVTPRSVRGYLARSAQKSPTRNVTVDPESAELVYETIDWVPPEGSRMSDGLYETYALQSIRIPGAQAHPTKLVQSAAMASVAPPKPSYRPRLPVGILDMLSDAQLETVIYSGEAHSDHLAGAWTADQTCDLVQAAPDGVETSVRFRRGFMLGDGTGAGKGRQSAGIILDNWLQGRRKAVWIWLRYLHGCVSTKRHRVRVPETPMYLDALLADQPLTGGLEPRLGASHLRVLTVTGFPTATTPGLLDELNRLAFPYRWSTRAILLDKTDATKLLTKIRRQWFAKRKSVAAILKEVMTNEASVLVDTDAANKAADADLALQELGADYAGMAFVTATVTVLDTDPRTADEKLRLVEKVIQGRDFTASPETINAVDAWLGSLPGHVYANVRQPPISTLNLAHMIPLSAVWAGPERDEHFAAPPLLFGKTEGSTPFRFSLHVGDVGHTLVVGPTGAGKSVLLALMALQFRRYAGAQVFAFDFGGSIRAAALAMDGDWHDLGGGLTESSEASVNLQPLARVGDLAERGWAADWIAAILKREGVPITPDVKEHIWTALTSLASAPVEERTVTGLAVLLQSNDLKQALRPYCVGGAYGRLLDAEAEFFGSASVQAFETEGLIGIGAASAVLAYLFHRIEDRLDGSPTLIIIDEGWLALDDEEFAGQLREWLKTLRKKNASVIFATQSLSDIDGSAIAPAIIESCQTRLLLPNERAIEPQITSIYRRFGLNDRQIEIIARAAPKRDYYCQSRRGNRLFELGLSDVAIALCAASSKTDQAAIAEILSQHGREAFLVQWLRHRGLGWAADLVPNLTNQDTRP